MVDNKIKIPIIRDDFWSKLINRMDTPVDLSSTTDLDGNPVSPVTPIRVSLPCQKIRRQYDGRLDAPYIQFENSWSIAEYIQLDMDKDILNEIPEKFSLPNINNVGIPAWLWAVEEAGDLTLDLRIESSVRDPSPFSDTHSRTYIRWYIQFGEDSPVLFNEQDFTDLGAVSGTRSTVYTYQNTVTLSKGKSIRIYGDIIADIAPFGTGSDAEYFIFSTRSTDTPSGVGGEVNPPTYFRLTYDTITDPSEGEGYLLHDAFHGVLERYGMGTSPFYSELLGSQMTNERAYPSNGCGWPYVVIKGLQVKGYTLSEKPFFTSFKHLWNGANPILNLGLGYEEIAGDQVVRIEGKDHFFEETISATFSNVRDMESDYDSDYIYKKISLGFKEWESENISGIDDPQTKQVRATRLTKTGIELDLESEFIAASLAIEQCRRASIEKKKDYKHDNKTFIIALNSDDLSPDHYTPELDENFDSITGLLNPETRYNSILTPLRSLLRWANVLGGCLQVYTDSGYKFVSGEGNYNAVFDYSCVSGEQCQAIICDPLAENDDIPLGAPSNYNSLFGYLFYPILYKINLPMPWDDFQEIKNNLKAPIGISQTEENHYKFYIKKLTYNLTSGQAELLAWPKGKVGSSGFDVNELYPDIEVIHPQYVPFGCPVERSLSDSDDDSEGVISDPELCYRITEDEDIRITEDGDYRVTENCD
jgi:hypothetical protein